MNTKIRLSITVKTTANGCNMCWPKTPNIVGYGCYTLRPFAHPVACCGVLLGVVAQSFKLILIVTYHHLKKCVSLSR